MIRDIQNTWIWRDAKHREKYIFWWIDLCLLARNKPSEYSADITLSRGEFVATTGFLQKRWNATEKTIRNFIAKLLTEQWISQRIVGKLRVYKIENYDEIYGNKSGSNGADNGNEKGGERADLMISTSATYNDQGQQKGSNGADNGNEKGGERATRYNIGNMGNREIDNNEMSNDIFVIGDADDAAPLAKAPTNPDKTIDLKKFMEYWNKTMQGKGLGRIVGIKNNRLLAIKARLREYGKKAIIEVVNKAAASTFLNNGKFNIDWIFCPNNFPKVLEGKYDNDRQQQKNAPNLPQNPKGGTKYKPSIFDARNEVLNELYAEINGDTDNSNTEETIHDADFAVVNG